MVEIARETETRGDAAGTKVPRPDFGGVPIRQAVFELSPVALRQVLGGHEYNEPEEPVDDSSDIDDPDNDEILPEEDENERHINQYHARLLEPIEFSESVTLTLQNVYPITICGQPGKGHTCRFEGPSWFYGKLPDDAERYIERLIFFLSAIGDWLEENKQAFLQTPTPENYVRGEIDFSYSPVVLQNGLLARINDRLSPDYRITKHDLSRLLNKVWLLWPEWNMPLQNVFTKEYHLEWVVQGCLAHSEKTGVWLEELSNDFSKDELMAAKSKDFGNLTLEEHFRVLCSAVSVNPKDVFRTVQLRLNSK